MKSKLGIVLSGGGHRGAAHAGILKAMETFGLQPDIVSGTSAGAVVGALYAAGHSPETILEAFKSIKLFSMSYFARRKAGFFDSDRFEKFLSSYFPKTTFEDLDKGLKVTATDLIKGEIRVFDTGEVIPAVLASAAVPGIFTPVEIGGSLYADGGVLDNFPVTPLQENTIDIYGSYVCPLKALTVKDFKHSYNVADRALQLMMHNNSVQKFKDCKLVFSSESLESFGLFKTGQTDRIYQIGYDTASRSLEKHLKTNTL